MDTVQIIILAAGFGKRMANQLPKVLIPLNGKPLILHLLESVRQSGVCETPVIVIGQKADQVRASLGTDYTYVIQVEQLGTGHAVACARSAVEGHASHVLVLYGDHPYVSAKTIRAIADAHRAGTNVLTMATTLVDDFEGWHQGFADFGRVVRDSEKRVSAIIERRDATAEQLEIREVNPSYFCFRADWLWPRLSQLTNHNGQHEYYLTDLAGIACREGQPITTVAIEPREALGVNTAEQLAVLSQVPDVQPPAV